MSEELSVGERLALVREKIAAAAESQNRAAEDVTLIAVGKTFDADVMRPVIGAGQRVFGENRVQEALGKWPGLKQEFPDLELHLIGPLQSNKAKDAVALFDVIHTVDREKIARVLSEEMKAQGRDLKLLVQVNTGEEPQKAGVMPKDVEDFVALCTEKYGLRILGLMCIPPVDEERSLHFALLAKLADRLGLEALSMGMSGDYETAVQFGASYVRVGSAIFGARG